MYSVNHLDDYRYKDMKCPVVTVGTFDGVHPGHLSILKRVKQVAEANGGESVLFTFLQHPRHVLSPNDLQPKLLTTTQEKLKLLQKAAVDVVVFHPFTSDFSALSYEEFVAEVLVKKLGTRYLIIGHDHRFGKDRQGGMEQLISLGPKYGFEVEEIPVQVMNDVQVSSTKIRIALDTGDIAYANRLLGYMYGFEGSVIEGMKLGRNIGFPTANIRVNDAFKLVPGNGAYAAIAHTNFGTFKAMVNIGIKPTVASNCGVATIEAHLFDFEENIYGEQIRLELVSRLRDEKRFAGLDELRKQLENDRDKSLEILAD